MTEDEMIGRQHQLNEHEFKQTPGNSEGQRTLSCYSTWSLKGSEMIGKLNNGNSAVDTFLLLLLYLQYSRHDLA